MRGFGNYIYNYAEDIIGISTGVYVTLKIPIANEILHSIFSIFTAIVSAYIIYVIKPYFSKVKIKQRVKKVFKNVNKRASRKSIK